MSTILIVCFSDIFSYMATTKLSTDGDNLAVDVYNGVASTIEALKSGEQSRQIAIREEAQHTLIEIGKQCPRYLLSRDILTHETFMHWHIKD